jgi:hypothetical protein
VPFAEVGAGAWLVLGPQLVKSSSEPTNAKPMPVYLTTFLSYQVIGHQIPRPETDQERQGTPGHDGGGTGADTTDVNHIERSTQKRQRRA